MRQRQPDCPQLQQARCPGIEYAARDVDMRNRIAIKQYVATPEIEQEGKNRNTRGKPRQQGCFAIPAPDRPRPHSRWVSSRKI